jgi:hypothetical protein
MRVYTVHLRRQGLDLENDIQLIKEGINWAALLFTALWALWHRLWWPALAVIAASMLVAGFGKSLGADEPTQSLLGFAVAAVLALLANDLRRAALERRGFTEAGVVCAADEDAALLKFMQAHPGLVEDA